MAKAKSGPKPWVPNDGERRLVEHYVAMGYTQEQVAALMEKSVDSLVRHCRRELDLGILKVNAKIGGKLFEKAMSGDPSCLIFWSKTRMGWKETSRHEHTGADGGSIQVEDPRMKILTDEELDILAKLDGGE